MSPARSSERWLPVAGYLEIYEVSSLGRVRSVDRKNSRGYRQSGKIMSQSQNKSGHMYVNLCRNSIKAAKAVHSLVAESFIGPRLDGQEACHRDGNPVNNVPSNIRWDSHLENMRDVVRHGRHANANKVACPIGHALTGNNLKLGREGSRTCRACAIERSRAYRDKRKFDNALADKLFSDIESGTYDPNTWRKRARK